eukprot:300219-Rhodomonas_salina.1
MAQNAPNCTPNWWSGSVTLRGGPSSRTTATSTPGQEYLKRRVSHTAVLGHDLSFGKHKGKHVSEVPPDYIRWRRKQNPSARMQQMVDKFNQYDQKRGFWAFVHLDMSAWDTCWKLCDDQGPGASAGKVFWTHLEAKGEGDWVDNIVKQKRAYTSSASEEPLAGITP